MNRLALLFAIAASSAPVFAAEEAVDSRFVAAKPDAAMGDWQGTPGLVAQVFPTGDGQYQANIFKAFDETDAKPVAILKGALAALNGDGWSGVIADGHFKASKGGEQFDLQHLTRTTPTLGARPPKGAVVLFDGRNLDAWAKKDGKNWLREDGPARWKLVEGGAVEVVPAADCLITKQKFGDCKIHVEFRTLGAPCNSGVYLQTRYEVNINETYGRLDGSPNAGLDNCTPKGTSPHIRASRPPLEWQTLDIDFRAPRFGAGGKQTEKPRATVLLNGVKVYDQQELNPPTGAAGRLGDAATGPLMLQEHGMPVQFRNIWLAETAQPSTSVAAGAPGGFHHPGVLVNRAQLDFIKAKVAAGAEPWKSAFEAAKASELGALNYTPKPRDEVCCGPRSTPDLGCKDEQRDSDAAYTQALLWHLSGNKIYAENAIKIMNAWSHTLTGGHTLANCPVQAAWCAEVWPRAAEFIRYTDADWSAADIAKFKEMLARQYVPSLIGGSCENGNKELSMSEALINIGVFNDDRALFDAGVKMWRGRAPATIYLTTDGPTPVKAANCDEMPIWGNKGYTTPFVDGLLQETCRDSQHANMALSA